MANRFWILGTGNTSDTAHWSALTGGVGGASVPVAGDVVAFDTNSGTGTVTDNTGLTCASITHTQPSLTVTATAAQTVTGAVTISAGTWITGAFTHSYGSFVSQSGTRTVNGAGSTINITQTANAANTWVLNAAGLTFTAPAVLNFNGGVIDGNFNPTMAGLTYTTVNVTAAGLWTFGAFTATTFTYTSTTNKRDSLSFSGNPTIAAGGTLSLTGNSVINRAFVKSNTLGTQRSISVPSGATVTVTNCDFQDINMTGTFSTGATASSIGDALGNTFGWSSVQPDASVSLTLASTGTINWSSATWTSSGAARTAPLPQDDVSLGSSSTATTLTADMPRLGRNIDSSGYLKTLSFASTPNTIFGNITLGAGATYSGTQALTLQGRGAQTITSNGKSFPQGVILAAFGGTYVVQDNFTTSGLTHTNGAFDGGSNPVSLGALASAGALTRALKSTAAATWSLTNNSGAIWGTSATLDLSAFFASIKYTGNNTTTATFIGSGFTYGTFNWSSTASTGTLIITGANTFAALQSDNTTARTIQFPNGVTQTIQPGGWQVSGKAGVLISITSNSAGNQATLSMASGTVAADYLSITDSAATGGATWYAGANSNLVSNDSGWLAGAAPLVPTHEHIWFDTGPNKQFRNRRRSTVREETEDERRLRVFSEMVGDIEVAAGTAQRADEPSEIILGRELEKEAQRDGWGDLFSTLRRIQKIEQDNEKAAAHRAALIDAYRIRDEMHLRLRRNEDALMVLLLN